jgi:hypothetical protein
MMIGSSSKSGACVMISLLFLGVLFHSAWAQSAGPAPAPATYPTQSYLNLMKNDIIVNSDIWDPELKIFTANYG